MKNKSKLIVYHDSVFIESNTSKYVLLENKIYHKMQREKLYNLHCKTDFNCVLFVFKKTQNYVRPIFEVASRL